jgi:hypothetical protein
MGYMYVLPIAAVVRVFVILFALSLSVDHGNPNELVPFIVSLSKTTSAFLS